jgi:hypothetical protein
VVTSIEQTLWDTASIPNVANHSAISGLTGWLNMRGLLLRNIHWGGNLNAGLGQVMLLDRMP